MTPCQLAGFRVENVSRHEPTYHARGTSGDQAHLVSASEGDITMAEDGGFTLAQAGDRCRRVFMLPSLLKELT